LELVCCSKACEEADCVQLTERESSVCKVICESQEPITFSKIKERTDLHQEVVSRVVHRLMVHGMVEKADGRYAGRCSQ